MDRQRGSQFLSKQQRGTAAFFSCGALSQQPPGESADSWLQRIIPIPEMLGSRGSGLEDGPCLVFLEIPNSDLQIVCKQPFMEHLGPHTPAGLPCAQGVLTVDCTQGPSQSPQV